MSETPRDCKHGHLARSCEICDLERSNARLQTALAAAQAALREIDAICDDTMKTNSDDIFDWMDDITRIQGRVIAVLQGDTVGDMCPVCGMDTKPPEFSPCPHQTKRATQGDAAVELADAIPRYPGILKD